MAPSSSGQPWMSPIANSRPLCFCLSRNILLVVPVLSDREQLDDFGGIFENLARRAVGIELARVYARHQSVFTAILERAHRTVFELAAEHFDQLMSAPLGVTRGIVIRGEVLTMFRDRFDQSIDTLVGRGLF